jgi:hypothetical protein
VLLWSVRFQAYRLLVPNLLQDVGWGRELATAQQRTYILKCGITELRTCKLPFIYKHSVF